MVEERIYLVEERQEVLIKYEKIKTELKHKLEYIKGAEALELSNREKMLKKFSDQQKIFDQKVNILSMSYEEMMTRFSLMHELSTETARKNRILERENINKSIKNEHDSILIEKYRK